MTTDTPVTVRRATPYSEVYHDPETGAPISTHSMLKTMRMCPRQAYYKYILRLKPQVLGRPLRFGTWMHFLLEAYYKGEDWEAKHRELTAKFGQLFDEEKEAIGDLPRDCMRTFKSYLWHYKEDPWKVHEVEMMVEVPLPDGSVYRLRLDMLIEDQYGLWIVDHKNHKVLPKHDFRILDAQSALYIWAVTRAGYDIQGHIWNYLRSKPPTMPELTKTTGKISRINTIDTDYYTLARGIKSLGVDPNEYAAKLRALKAMQYRDGEPQTSPFFRRDRLEKTPRMLRQVASEAYQTHLRMHNYHWDQPNKIERNPGNHCQFMCSYNDVCTAELFVGNADNLIRSRYKVGDPLDYYQDEKPGQGKGEE